MITAKAMADCGNPPFSTVSVLQAEGNFLGVDACLQDYDLRICTNYKDILDSAKELPRGTLKNWFAPYVLCSGHHGHGLQHQGGKQAGAPTRTCSLRNTRGGSAFLPVATVGNSWLQVLNKTLGGNEDDIDPGIAFLVELMKKNQPLIVENADAGLKAFAREEIVIMPYWNGRTHVLQS